jgi:membrane protein CcdC involved in cytochrome C biogenesis
VDYSLFMMVAMLVMLERLEKRPEVTLAVFLPPIFAGTASILWFRISPCLLVGTPRGVFIEAFLGQADQSEMKTDGIEGSRAKRHLVV